MYNNWCLPGIADIFFRIREDNLMKRKVIAAALLATVFMSACNSSAPKSTTPTTTVEETTTTVEETTTEATTEATEETTEETSAEPVMLDMTTADVIQVILDAAGEEYFIFVDDEDSWKTTISHSGGIVDYMTCGYIAHLEGDDMVDGYNTIYITFEVYEFDVNSEQYKNVCETGEFIISRGEDPFVKKHAVVNGQFVLVAGGALCNDYEFHPNSDPIEYEPPYTIGKTQEGYDAFLALK